MDELQNLKTNSEEITSEMTIENHLEIIEDGMRKNYLSSLAEMPIAPVGEVLPLEEDLIDNVRLYRITEMVYPKGESVEDKFATVFNTLSTYKSTVFIIMDSNGIKTDFYVGVRNNEQNEQLKRSTVTLGDTLKNTLVGHFPGIKINNENRFQIAELSNKILSQPNVASVSVVGNKKSTRGEVGEHFVQGLEKLALAMQGRQYTGILVAENKSPQVVRELRSDYQELYTKLSPYQKVQFTKNDSFSTSKSKSFTEMDGKQKAAMIGNFVLSLASTAVGATVGTRLGEGMALAGSMIGGQITGQLNGFINSLAPNEQITESTSTSTSQTTENKAITDLLQLLDDSIKRTYEYDSYGMWHVAGYFTSEDISAAEIAASNYRSLMSGENSGRQVTAINSWRRNNPYTNGDYNDLITYLSRFVHPQFYYWHSGDGHVLIDPATAISGKELGIHLGLPRATVSGLPVIEHAEFGKEVTAYRLFDKKGADGPENRITLGKVFDLGQITNKIVELDNESLNMHTFITGSTGSGKSNTVYQILTELHQDGVSFLVIEPAKGEYKDVFGNWDDVNVYSTNPNIAPLIQINPFKFPESIHVLEHVDGLVEIFSACWPLYDAMPAFFKDAILKSYEEVGWDLGSSTFDGDDIEYPDFEVLVEQLNNLIEASDYASDIKSNYRGALITRVKSLAVGLNKFIFTSEQTPYKNLFDENCILDISRVKSNETKALIMGLMVYILNEYRMDQKNGNNHGLKHVTVLEEAHNLLKNTAIGATELIGKSVEMLTQTIAEIRTYGEGFIIVDQSPSSVDISAIKNTNTKIVLRTPEANDREAVGRSMGLTENQVNEIAKLPSGVAVVYQNDWVSPILTMVDKADVEDAIYIHEKPMRIKSMRKARTEVIRAIMEPWMPGDVIEFFELASALNTLEISKASKKLLSVMICTYRDHNGHILWDKKSLSLLKYLLFDILDVSTKVLDDIINTGDPDALRRLVAVKTIGFTADEVEEICYILTMEK